MIKVKNILNLLLIIGLFSSLSALNLKKIDEDTLRNKPEINIKPSLDTEKEDEEQKPTVEIKDPTKEMRVVKPKLKYYNNIYYYDELLPLSLVYYPTEESLLQSKKERQKEVQKKYKRILEDYGVANRLILRKIFGSIDNNTAVIVSALGYDWVYQRPDLAENFYQILKEKAPKLSLYNRMLMADYYIRTNRFSAIGDILSNVDCASSFKLHNQCNYYYGLYLYFAKKKYKNRILSSVTSKYPRIKKLLSKENK